MMLLHTPVIAAGVVTKLELANQSQIHQRPKGVIDRSVGDSRIYVLYTAKDLIGRGMIVGVPDDVENCTPLPGKTWQRLLQSYPPKSRLSLSFNIA